jgi:HEAT repeat protein
MAAMLRHELENGTLTAAEALTKLTASLAAGLPRAKRISTYQLVGDIAGRAFDATWEVAERAAWVLIGSALGVDAPSERRELLAAFGRGFRNLWLIPYVHGRLADEDEEIVAAAIAAAGGLGFPGLEMAVAAFLDEDKAAPLRLAAVRALGRVGAWSAAARLAAVVAEQGPLAAPALTALTEIRSVAGVDAALKLLAGEPAREPLIAGVRYLAEMGNEAVRPHILRLSRDADAGLRLVATQAARALATESSQDASERLLVALTERDRVARARLARRLRPLPIADVLAHAEIFLADDAEGVVMVVGELRGPEVTRFLLGVAADAKHPPVVRARAVGAIEAHEAWARDELVKVCLDDGFPDNVRLAAAQALSGFATLDETLAKLKPLATSPAPLLRGALLWALQLAQRPRELTPAQRKDLEALFRKALEDPEPAVRRRAAYVTGNLRLLALVPDLVNLAKRDEALVDSRIAAFIALRDIAPGDALQQVVMLFRREEDAGALVPASRAVAAAASRLEGKPGLEHLSGKVEKLLTDADPRKREAGARVAGLGAGVPTAAVLARAADESSKVRETALYSLGRLAAAGAAEAGAIQDALAAALDDPDEGMRERAAEALLTAGGERALALLVGFASGESDAATRASIAQRLEVPAPLRAALRQPVSEAVARLDSEDPAWEPLLRLRMTLLETPQAAGAPPVNVDDEIAKYFPMWRRLSLVPGFQPLARSLRTAEALYRSISGADADPSPPIILWMKTLEGYVHAWLSGRLQKKQNELLWDHVERLAGPTWPAYSRWLAQRWPENVDVGGMKVEVPLRAVPNALKELLERRQKRLDSPLSVTEWGRLLVLLGVNHESGVKNIVDIPARSAEQVVKVAHRLCVLAAVRNAVTHRTNASAATVDVFRRSYYTGFEDLTALA